MTPLEQIEARNKASRADAVALAPNRFAAASRALSTLAAEIDHERSAADARVDQLSAVPSTSKAAPPKVSQPKHRGDGTDQVEAVPAPPSPPTTRTSAPAPVDTTHGSPLLEVKPSLLATDVDHIGDRLAIFTDRVELHDRSDQIRQVILSDDITDVVVHKGRIGAVLSIENVDGPSIVAKGLRLEQADAARDLIMRKTRPARPIDRKPSTPPAPRPPKTGAKSERPTPKPAPSPTSSEAAPTSTLSRALDEGDLLRALAELHHAGILTDAEYDDKVVLVGRLARGESLTRSGH